MKQEVARLMEQVKAKNPAEPEFHQAVEEVASSLVLVMEKHPEYRTNKILERLIEPERVIMFRVPWLDDAAGDAAAGGAGGLGLEVVDAGVDDHRATEDVVRIAAADRPQIGRHRVLDGAVAEIPNTGRSPIRSATS